MLSEGCRSARRTSLRSATDVSISWCLPLPAAAADAARYATLGRELGDHPHGSSYHELPRRPPSRSTLPPPTGTTRPELQGLEGLREQVKRARLVWFRSMRPKTRNEYVGMLRASADMTGPRPDPHPTAPHGSNWVSTHRNGQLNYRVRPRYHAIAACERARSAATWLIGSPGFASQPARVLNSATGARQHHVVVEVLAASEIIRLLRR
jgi:hypothetical protein